MSGREFPGIDIVSEILQRAELSLNETETLLRSEVLARAGEILDRMSDLSRRQVEARNLLKEQKDMLFQGLFDIARDLAGKKCGPGWKDVSRDTVELSLQIAGLSVQFIYEPFKGGCNRSVLFVEIGLRVYFGTFVNHPLFSSQFWLVIRGLLKIIAESMEMSEDHENAEQLRRFLGELSALVAQ